MEKFDCSLPLDNQSIDDLMGENDYEPEYNPE